MLRWVDERIGESPSALLTNNGYCQSWQILRRKAVLLSGRNGHEEGFSVGTKRVLGEASISIEIGDERIYVHVGISIEGGGVEPNISDHPGTGFVPGIQIVNGGEVVVLKLHSIGRDCVSNLGCAIDV